MEALTDYEHAREYYYNFSPDGWYIEYRFDALEGARKIVGDVEDLVWGFRLAARENLAMIGTVRYSDSVWALLVAGRLADRDVLDIHERVLRGSGRFQRLAAPKSSQLRATEWGPQEPND